MHSPSGDPAWKYGCFLFQILVFPRLRSELVQYPLCAVSMTSDGSIETLKSVHTECSSYRRALLSGYGSRSIFAKMPSDVRRQPCQALHCKKTCEQYAEYK
jgi:hypothetical protein